MTLIKSDSSLLAYLFHEGRFEVPWHQRYYDWTNENVAELLQDIDEAFKEDRKCYFLGTIIWSKSRTMSGKSMTDSSVW